MYKKYINIYMNVNKKYKYIDIEKLTKYILVTPIVILLSVAWKGNHLLIRVRIKVILRFKYSLLSIYIYLFIIQ